MEAGHQHTPLVSIMDITDRFWFDLIWIDWLFMTTFLHIHSWLNWVDKDDVGLKEKPEDTRYITNITSK